MKLKALVITLLVGSSSIAMAQPYRDRPGRPDYRRPERNRITMTGSYTSEFGPVELRQRGEIVTGTFAAGGGGRIEGRIVGSKVLFRWWNSQEKGRGVWYMANPDRIEGTWGKRRSETDGGVWNLTRS